MLRGFSFYDDSMNLNSLTWNSPVFTYTERNDNLRLCVIQDILTYAFLDSLTAVLDHRYRTSIHFKKSLYETPIFRRASRDENGIFTTDSKLSAPYSQFREYKKEASLSAAFRERGSPYKYRKGAAANLIRHLEHSSNIIMGHQKGGTFANYVSVRDDTQSPFIETPTRDSLIKLASNTSLTRDESVPQVLTSSQHAALENDPKILQLKTDCQLIRNDLMMEHDGLKKAQKADDKRYSEFLKLQKKDTTQPGTSR
ncbi:hypothetical protein N7519_001399 [Penicillium mononematosum]|uniref:uncharacterized protein n=1 Tax=Penicillium mononematosum TaxID=268346 RepID=UPI002548C380|nr:uncharacterized protein N7519_001399 [Penicillium mononematosum]KAJ6191378.1 hypothetical protein N7519_001399 [Penicillium mononematosum]